MEIITFESEAYQSLVDRLDKIQEYVESTYSQISELNDDLEMTTQDLIKTLKVSESTLYRWRKRNLIQFRYTESGEVRYHFKYLYQAFKCNKLRVTGLTTEQVIACLNTFRDHILS